MVVKDGCYSRLSRSLLIGLTAGDEFALMLPNMRRKTDAADFTYRILKPFPVAQRLITVKATVGISIYPEDAQDAMYLLRGADATMYQGKTLSRNTFQFFTPEIPEEDGREVGKTVLEGGERPRRREQEAGDGPGSRAGPGFAGEPVREE